jgi:hypothetical protein
MTTSNHAIERDHAVSSVAAAVLGCLTNLAAALSREKLSHQEVLETQKSCHKFRATTRGDFLVSHAELVRTHCDTNGEPNVQHR